MRQKEEEWAMLMRAAVKGDGIAYRKFLVEVAPAIRAMAKAGLARFGAHQDDAEDIVQETLLAIHVKRQTWDATRPIGPWIMAIARHKLIDALRRRGLGRLNVPIDDVPDAPAAANTEFQTRHDVDRVLADLPERQRSIVKFLSTDGGGSVKETAQRFGMSEGAVRVVLHRAIRRLAALYRTKNT
jgi:RNA polymerase sigma factor (sigma-70 family)